MSFRFRSFKEERAEEIKLKKARALEIIGGTGERHVKDKLEQNHSVKTGLLVGSIAHEPRGDSTVAIGTNVKYGPYVELGHNQQPGRYVPAIGKRLKASHVAAKPYLRPGIEEHTDEFERIVQTEMSL